MKRNNKVWVVYNEWNDPMCVCKSERTAQSCLRAYAKHVAWNYNTYFDHSNFGSDNGAIYFADGHTIRAKVYPVCGSATDFIKAMGISANYD